jgi:hypothetical protein
MSKENSSETKATVEKCVSAFADQVPTNLQPFVLKASPVLGEIACLVEKAVPIFEEYYVKLTLFWRSLEPYKPHLLIPAFVGLILCFFGGSFLTLIAAIEAFRMCGYDSTSASFQILSDDFHKIVDVNKKGTIGCIFIFLPCSDSVFFAYSQMTQRMMTKTALQMSNRFPTTRCFTARCCCFSR